MKSAYLWIFSLLSIVVILFACVITQRPTPPVSDEETLSKDGYYDENEKIFTLDPWEIGITPPMHRPSASTPMHSVTAGGSDVVIEDTTGEASVTYWRELSGTLLPLTSNTESSETDDPPLTGPPWVYGEVLQIFDHYCIIEPFVAAKEYECYVMGDSVAMQLLAVAPQCLVPTIFSGTELLEDVAVGDIIRVVFGYSSAKVETAYPDVVVLSTVIAAYPFPDPTFLY